MSTDKDQTGSASGSTEKSHEMEQVQSSQETKSVVDDSVVTSKPGLEEKAGSKKETVTSKKAEPSEKNTENAAGKKRGGSKFLLFVFILILLLGAAGAGYWLYQQDAFVAGGADAEVSELSELSEQRELITSIQRGLEKERELRQQLTAQLDNQFSLMSNSLTAQENRVRELGGSSRQDWLLAEAEFLLRLANQRLIIERDTANALALLTSADQILRDLDDVALNPVRKTLARDITALGLVSKVDTEGLYFRLGAIIEQVSLVPLLPVQPIDEQLSQQAAQVAEPLWWKQLWRNFVMALSGLKDIVRVQHHQQVVMPLLTGAQEQSIKMTLSLVLEQAQVALLRRKDDVFQSSLSKAQLYLSNYYQLDSGSEQLITQLEALKQQQLGGASLDISAGLKNLQQYIDARHARYVIKQKETAQ